MSYRDQDYEEGGRYYVDPLDALIEEREMDMLLGPMPKATAPKPKPVPKPKPAGVQKPKVCTVGAPLGGLKGVILTLSFAVPCSHTRKTRRLCWLPCTTCITGLWTTKSPQIVHFAS